MQRLATLCRVWRAFLCLFAAYCPANPDKDDNHDVRQGPVARIRCWLSMWPLLNHPDLAFHSPTEPLSIARREYAKITR